MRLLLTNDDGYDCEGIQYLAEELEKDHEVWVMAPDSERSGTSHAITLKGASKLRKIAERRFTCSGMPADCVILSILGILPFRPDAVISGINRGPNLGTDLVYSGTAAAARQAALYDIPALAVSLAGLEAPFLFREASRFVALNLSKLLNHWKQGIFLNLNIPNSSGTEHRIEMAKLAIRSYSDNLKRFTAPDGSVFCFLADGKIETLHEEGTDHWFVDQGCAALSKVLIRPCCDGGML